MNNCPINIEKQVIDLYNKIGFIDIRPNPNCNHFKAHINLNNDFLDEFINYFADNFDFSYYFDKTSITMRNIMFYRFLGMEERKDGIADLLITKWNKKLSF